MSVCPVSLYRPTLSPCHPLPPALRPNSHVLTLHVEPEGGRACVPHLVMGVAGVTPRLFPPHPLQHQAHVADDDALLHHVLQGQVLREETSVRGYWRDGEEWGGITGTGDRRKGREMRVRLC